MSTIKLSNFSLFALESSMNERELVRWENIKAHAAKIQEGSKTVAPVDLCPLVNVYDNAGDVTSAEPTEQGSAPSRGVAGVRLDVVCPGINAWYVSLAALCYAEQDAEMQQRAIVPSEVFDILHNPDNGLLRYLPDDKTQTHKLYEPITVGYSEIGEDGMPMESEVFKMIGGRHRRCAIITLAMLCGFDVDSEEVQDLLIRVNPEIYDIRKIITNNSSRSVATVEKAEVKLLAKGVAANTISGLADAMANKQITASDFFSRSFALMQQRETDCIMQYVTAAQIGTALATALRNTEGVVLPKSADKLADIAADAWYAAKEGASEAIAKGATNLSREGKSYIVNFIIDAISDTLKDMMKESLVSKAAGNKPVQDKQAMLKQAKQRKTATPVDDGLETAAKPEPAKQTKSRKTTEKPVAPTNQPKGKGKTVVALRQKNK